MISIKVKSLHFRDGKQAIKVPCVYRFVRYSGTDLTAEYYLFPFNLIERIRDKLAKRRRLRLYKHGK